MAIATPKAIPQVNAKDNVLNRIQDNALSGIRKLNAAVTGLQGQITATAAQAVNVKDSVFGAKGDGATDDTGALNAAIAAASPLRAACLLPGGIYRVTGAVRMRPNVTLISNFDATIRQGDAANIPSGMVDFSTYTATNAGLFGLTLDGNRANNNENAGSFFLVYGTGGNDALIQNCLLKGSPGYGVVFQGAAARPKLLFNRFTDINIVALGLDNTFGTTSDGEIFGNRFDAIGQHPIVLASDHHTVIGNQIVGTQAAGLHVSTNGTAVTWVSGPDFSTLKPGMFIVIANGTEYSITAVASTTVLTIGSSAGTQNNVVAIAGTGDMISLKQASHCLIGHNSLEGGVTGGIVIDQMGAGTTSQRDIISGNRLFNIGGDGAGTSGTPGTAKNIAITDNQIVNCGQGTAANPAYAMSGIHVTGPNVSGLFLDGNDILDDQGGGATMAYGIYLDATLAAGSVKLGKNEIAGAITGKVFPYPAVMVPFNSGVNLAAFGAAAPVSGTWGVGDIVYNSAVAIGQPNGWRCTVAGTPGTWVAMNNL